MASRDPLNQFQRVADPKDPVYIYILSGFIPNDESSRAILRGVASKAINHPDPKTRMAGEKLLAKVASA